MTITTLTDLAAQLGAFGVAVLVLWALMTDRLVTRGRLQEMRDELERCREELRVEQARKEDR